MLRRLAEVGFGVVVGALGVVLLVLAIGRLIAPVTAGPLADVASVAAPVAAVATPEPSRTQMRPSRPLRISESTPRKANGSTVVSARPRHNAYARPAVRPIIARVAPVAHVVYDATLARATNAPHVVARAATVSPIPVARHRKPVAASPTQTSPRTGVIALAPIVRPAPVRDDVGRAKAEPVRNGQPKRKPELVTSSRRVALLSNPPKVAHGAARMTSEATPEPPIGYDERPALLRASPPVFDPTPSP